MKTTYFLDTDLRGSTRAVCDANGKPVAWLGYEPFGASLESACGGDARLVDRLTRRYTGQVFEQESGLYHYGARLYDDALARFVAADTAHQTPDPYAYCANDPVDHTDPDGREITLIIQFNGAWYLFDDDGEFWGEVALSQYLDYKAKPGIGLNTTTSAKLGVLYSTSVFVLLPDAVQTRIGQAADAARANAEAAGSSPYDADAARQRAWANEMSSYLESIVVKPIDLHHAVAPNFASWMRNYENASQGGHGKFYWPIRPHIDDVQALDLATIAPAALTDLGREKAEMRVNAPRVIRNRHLGTTRRTRLASHSPYYGGAIPSAINKAMKLDELPAIRQAFKNRHLPDPEQDAFAPPPPVPSNIPFDVDDDLLEQLEHEGRLRHPNMAPFALESSSSEDDEHAEL